MRIDSSGGVGIGATTIPADHRLQIHNPSAAYSRFALTNSTTGSASGDGLKFQMENLNAIIKNQENGYLTFGTNGRETDLRIDSSGNVGIGETSPSHLLHIKKPSSGDAGLMIETVTGGDPTLYFNSAAANRSGLIRFQDNGTNIGRIEYVHNGDRLAFQAGSATGETMSIINGAVGIGTDSPNALLEISGIRENQIRLTSYDTTAAIDETIGGIEFYSSDTGNEGVKASISAIAANTEGSAYMTFSSGTNTERMRIIDTGYIKARGRNTTGYEYPTNTFHSLEANESNEPTLVLFNDTTSNAYGLNVINGTDHNNTTSRFFLGQGGSTERIKIFSNGNVANTNNSYTALSDIKLKENITDATPKLNDLMQVKIRNYNLIGEELKQIGVVAQELEEVFPALVYETPDTERQDINKTDEEGNIIYQTEEVLISEAVEGQEAIEWQDKPTMDNTKVEIQTWLDDNEIEWQSADTKQELLDRIPEYQQEAVEAQDAVYETRETDIPETVNKEVDLGTTTKAVKYSVFVPMLIKAMQEQQEIINDLKARIEALEN